MKEVTLKQALPYITGIFILFSMWNIYQQHKYRKLEYEFKTKHQVCDK